MYRLTTTALVALATMIAVPATGHAQGGMMGMMGGGCPTIGMMGNGPGAGFGWGMGGGWGNGGWGGGMMGRQPRMGAMVEGRLAYLKGELGITQTQQVAWDTYEKAVKQRVELMQDLHEGMTQTIQEGNATERMDARITGMEAMVESMKAMKPATEALYAVLTDEQKAIADDLIGGDCGAF